MFKPLCFEDATFKWKNLPPQSCRSFQDNQNGLIFWLSWEDLQLWCWRFLHFRLTSLKQKSLKLVLFGKFFKYMFCTLNFMVSFQYFQNSKWIFVQHSFCSLCQYLSNHYSYAYVWIFQMGLLKRWIFVIIYGNQVKSSCTS